MADNEIDNDFEFNLEKAKKDQQDAQNKKSMFGALGAIGAGFDRVPTAASLLYNQKVPQSNIGGSFDQMAKDVVDPTERQMKLYQAYKAAKDAESAGDQQDYTSDAHDPNSDTSKAFRAAIQASTPKIAAAMGDSFGLVTAADKDKIFDPMKWKEITDARRDASNARYQERADKKREKEEADRDKLAKQFKDDMDANKGRSGNFGQISAKVQQADRLKTLVDSYKDGDLPPQQMEELALGMANMLSGQSGAARAQVEALVPHTWYGAKQSAEQWLMNEPKGAGQQKFVEQMAHTIDRERETANQQLNDIRRQRLGAHKRFQQMDPDQYNIMLHDYGIDPDDPVASLANKQKSYSPDVVDYAQKHGISTEEAQGIKDSRTSNVGSR